MRPPYQVGPVRYRPPLSTGWVQLSVAVRVGVGLSGVLALNDAVSSVWELLTARQVTVGDNLGIAPILTEVLGSVGSLSSLVTGSLWLIWQYQLANSATVDRLQVRRSPEWHVASWVVPIVALWFPLQDIRDLWRAVTDPSRWQQLDPLLWLWWPAFLIGSSMVATVVVDYPASLVVSAVVSFSVATAAIPAVLIVTRITTAALERQQGALQAQRG